MPKSLKQRISDAIAYSLMAAVLGNAIYYSIRQYTHPSIRKAPVTKHAAERSHVSIIEYGDINCDGLEDKVQFWENTSPDSAVVIAWGTADGKFDPNAKIVFYCN